MQKQRTQGLPPHYRERVEALLQTLGYSLDDPKKIAAAVLRLSDHYIDDPLAKTPWTENWAQAASLAYYFPLNYARNAAIFSEAVRLGFFADLERAIDFGCGAGSAISALGDLCPELNPKIVLDVEAHALSICKSMAGPDLTTLLIPSAARTDVSEPHGFRSTGTLVTASYAMTELSEPPAWWFGAEALAIVEPSTQADGRKLMQLRERLIDKGFHIWAPCTHQVACPLMTQSERDWCHDRIFWQAPDWFVQIEKHLPIKNRTITFSYLLARKRPAPSALKGLARLTGDRLDEKGKTRQSVCRGPNREFLSWFPQRLKTPPPDLERGLLVRFVAEPEVKANELRLKDPATGLETLKPDQPL